jgi:hypothetical protein
LNQPSELNDSQLESWHKSIEVFEDGHSSGKTVALFPEDRLVEIDDVQAMRIRLKDVELSHPRQGGTCWLAIWPPGLTPRVVLEIQYRSDD